MNAIGRPCSFVTTFSWNPLWLFRFKSPTAIPLIIIIWGKFKISAKYKQRV